MNKYAKILFMRMKEAKEKYQEQITKICRLFSPRALLLSPSPGKNKYIRVTSK